MEVSLSHFRSVLAENRHLKAIREREKEKTTKIEQHAIRAFEVVGAAGAMSYVNHRFGHGEMKLMAAADGSGGVPVDGLGFLLVHLGAFFSPAKYSEHLHNVANGLGASFAVRAAADKGDKDAAAAQGGGAASTSGPLSFAHTGAYPSLSPYVDHWAGRVAGTSGGHPGYFAPQQAALR